MQGESLRGERQLRQAGIELIGPATPEADAEVIIVAASALKKAGVENFSVDVNMPGIISNLLAAEALDEDQLKILFDAVAHKDVSTIRTLSFAYRDSLIGLLQSAGPASTAIPAIERLELPESAKRQLRDLKHMVEILAGQGWNITIDATESRGAGYYSGSSFSIFVPGVATEVGRGGRYRVDGLDATGFTLYVETLLDIVPEAARAKRIFVPEGIAAENIAALQAEGFTTIYALSEYGASEDEAKRLGCDYIFKDNKIIGLLDD